MACGVTKESKATRALLTITVFILFRSHNTSFIQYEAECEENEGRGAVSPSLSLSLSLFLFLQSPPSPFTKFQHVRGQGKTCDQTPAKLHTHTHTHTHTQIVHVISEREIESDSSWVLSRIIIRTILFEAGKGGESADKHIDNVSGR